MKIPTDSVKEKGIRLEIFNQSMIMHVRKDVTVAKKLAYITCSKSIKEENLTIPE